MNYSLETFNEASVGGWASEKGGVVAAVQVKAAVTLPKEHPPPPLIPPLLFTSLFRIPTFSSCWPLLLFPWSLFFPSLFSACPPPPHSHFRCLTQHMLTPLCTSGHLKIKKQRKKINMMHQCDVTLPVCQFCLPLCDLFVCILACTSK